MPAQSSDTKSKTNSGELDCIDQRPFALQTIDSEISLFFRYSPSLIGRNRKKCHLILKHISVSRIHCALFWSRNNLCISDLGSRNGVYVNQKRVRFIKLSAGDKIQIGKYQFQFVDVVNNSNGELMLQETKKSPQKSFSDREFTLQDLAISPPSVTPQDLSTYPDDIELAELDDISSELELDDEVEEKDVSTYAIKPSTESPKGPKKLTRRKYSVPDDYKENRRNTAFISFSMNVAKENPLLKRFFYTAVLIVVFWGLKTFWNSGYSDQEIYYALQTKLDTVQTHRQNGAGPSEWESLTKRSESELQPIIGYLEKNASAKNRVKQELLRAARDCFPKVFLESRQGISSHEKRLEKHLEIARLILDGNDIEEKNYNFEYATKPPGS